MSILYNLKKSIHNELSYFDFFLKKTVKSSIPLINNINKYLHNNKGKQIRPIFVFLSALLTGKITDKTYRSAVLIEMLHIATLMHDDVIDNSYERRGNFSVNALWNNRTSILFGDYIFSKIISLLVENKDFDILSILMNLINNMSEGEILQSEKSRMLDMNKKIYFTIINNKTASFIKTCCSIGLISSNININNNNVKNIELFGQYIGIAFQIQDDIFDFNNLKTGKSLYNDIKQKKITLPLIYALDNASKKEKDYIIYMIKNIDRYYVMDIVNFVKKNNGIEYSKEVVKKYINKAIHKLHKFPNTISRNNLEKLTEFILKREY